MPDEKRAPLDPASFDQRLTHDLQAPISTARGLLGLAEEDAGDGVWDEMPELLAGVRTQLDRLDALVGRLADLSASRRPCDALESVALQPFMHALFAEAGLDTAERPVRLLATIGELSLRSNPLALERLLAPLLDNACRFGEADERTERVVRVNAQRDHDTVVIDIEDDGVGFDDADTSMFEPFRRGHAAPASAGLGLAIAAAQAETLGGELSLSSPRAPTRLRVRLPVAGPPEAGD